MSRENIILLIYIWLPIIAALGVIAWVIRRALKLWRNRRRTPGQTDG